MLRRVLILTVSLPMLAVPAASSLTDSLEYQIKAAYLFNFLKFMEWPSAASGTSWVIGVLGRDPFGTTLSQTVDGKSVNGRSVELRRFTRSSDVKDCNILFIGGIEYEHTGTPIKVGLLTVGESAAFLKSGGIVNFYFEDNHVHFEIRPAAAQAAGLRVSAQLLKLGRAR